MKNKLKHYHLFNIILIVLFIFTQTFYILISITNLRAEETPNILLETFRITFRSPPEVVSGVVTIYAETNGMLTGLEFYVVDQNKKTGFPFKSHDIALHSFEWDTTKFANGEYQVEVYATSGAETASDSITVRVENKAVFEEAKPEDLTIYFINPPATASGTATMQIQTNIEAEKVDFKVSGPQSKNYPGLSEMNLIYFFRWDTKNFPNGEYTIEAQAVKGEQMVSESIKAAVKNESIVSEKAPEKDALSPIEKTPPVEKTPPEEKQPPVEETIIIKKEEQPSLEVKSPEEEKVAEEDGQPKEPVEAAKSEEIPPPEPLPWRCIQAGITIQEDCGDYLFKISLPWECREAAVKTKTECNLLIATSALPLECQKAGIQSSLECDNFLFKQYGQPEECQDLTLEECKDYLETAFVLKTLLTPPQSVSKIRTEKLPKDCRDANILQFNECEKYMIKKYLPRECLDAGVETPTACEQFMQEKFGRPPECASLTDEECQKLMNKIQPLTVQHIVASQEVPLECREAGLSSLTQCETFIREQHLPAICRQKGAKDKKTCAKMMEEEYGQLNECSNLSPAECENLVAKVILSDFIDQETLEKAQEEVKIITDKHITLSAVTIPEEKQPILDITVQEGEEKIKLAKDAAAAIEQVVPLAKTQEAVGITVRGSTEKEEKAKTVVAAVLLFDQDGDGLNDELEERLGTNPKAPDSDNDGEDDAIEIATNRNPLGPGEKVEKLEPVEQAIVNKMPLEQPRTAGITASEILKVEKVENKINQPTPETGETKKTLEIRGKALPEEVVSLFIYSNMPIVMTVDTDINGNWVYNLDKSLVDGKHEAYVVVHDQEGRIKSKSSPLAFFIKEAQAVNRDEFIKANLPTVDQAVVAKTERMLWWYIAGGGLLVLFGILLYFLNNKLRRNVNQQ